MKSVKCNKDLSTTCQYIILNISVGADVYSSKIQPTLFYIYVRLKSVSLDLQFKVEASDMGVLGKYD